MSKLIKCPQCKKPTEYNAENPYRPFCSHRCQLIDLGEWADEKYSIAGSQENSKNQEEIEESGENLEDGDI